MSISYIKQIIEQNKDDISFIIGNGINRYSNNTNALSWEDLIRKLWKIVTNERLENIPKGISITEIYDLLEFKNNRRIKLQQEIKNLMEKWNPSKHHKNIIKKISLINAPILTTNFDETLARTYNYKLFKIEKKGFTHHYPWETYYAKNQIKSPLDGFGIWHINGMIYYYTSIRLGLSHYMGSVHKAKSFLEYLYKRNTNSKFYKTWLNIFFNKSIFIFGLALEKDEIFLRWLLIERQKYYNQYPENRHKGWYLTKKDENVNNTGKKIFLKQVGIEYIEVDDYKDIYENIWD